MARRIAYEQGTSRLAIWARRVAVFSLLAAVLASVIVHSGFLEIRPALVTFGAALTLAAVAIILAFSAFVTIWNEGLLGVGAAVTAIVIAILLLAYPAFLVIRSHNLPWLSDITTDTIDPPRFETLARARPRDANPIAYPGATAAEQQNDAYPDIEPLDADIDPLTAYKASFAIVNRRRWTIVEARAPDQGRTEGRIEAVARTPIMGFRDDVVVRVKPFEGGARVDVRSSSRYGKFDFGTNAARVRQLLGDIEQELARETPGEAPIARPKVKSQPKAPAKQPPGKQAPNNQPPAKR